MGEKKKTCPGVLGAARASAGARLAHSLTPAAPDKPERHPTAGQLWWLGSTGRGLALQVAQGLRMY